MTKNNTERIEIAQRGNTQNDEREKLQISVLTEKRGEQPTTTTTMRESIPFRDCYGAK
jgi:septum formation topological specificity factor MinE